MTTALRLGTRGSALALAQSQLVADALTAATGRPVELVRIVTSGDRSAAPVTQLGVGVFVSALRDAMLAGEIDFAVHSYKDLPTAGHPGLFIAAVPERADPRDALIARDGMPLAALPAGARIGTGAVRRVAQLHALGLQLRVTPIRGNVDSRIARVLGPQADLDAVVLARAGVVRLGRAAEITETLDPELMLPAPAQGALAVECRADDEATLARLAAVDHRPSHVALDAERAYLREVGGGCDQPVGAYATVADDGRITLEALLAGADGQVVLRHTVEGDDPSELGRRAARYLIDDAGGSMLLEASLEG